MSPHLIYACITTNVFLDPTSGIFLDLSGELGTLEAGKLTDIVIIDGDSLTDISDLANVAVVIKGGRVVVDNR